VGFMLEPQTLVVFLLAAFATGGAVWVFLYPHLSGERSAEKRRAMVTQTKSIVRTSSPRDVQRARRDQVEEALKELDNRQRKKGLPLSIRMAQAGLTWSKQRFIVTAIALGLLFFAIAFVLNAGLIPALGIGFAASCGLPFWLLSFLKQRRETRFLNAFPDAIDIIVRGIKAGLPLSDSLRAIAEEAQEPVRGEFRAILETQMIGLPLGDACAKLYERVPVAEANFFAIVIGIQQKTGGNLSETLGNLSRVLRDRKKMKAKIKAMSMEAKASATIIATLPIAVMLLVYLTSPSYIELLWSTELGRTMLAGSAVWMLIGVLVMRKMINFDF